MSSLLIRDVDDDLMLRLKTKAELNQTSLQHEASQALKRGSPLTPAERAAVFEQLRRTLGGFPKVRTSGGDLIREMREEED